MSIDLTRADHADLAQLVALLAQLFAQESEFVPDAAAQRRGLAAILDDPAVGLILVARRGETVVAMVNLLFTISTALGARVAILEDMVVAADARGAGIGRRLLDFAIEQARLAQCRRITLLTDTDNDVAHHFYQGRGFQRSDMRPFRLLMK